MHTFGAVSATEESRCFQKKDARKSEKIILNLKPHALVLPHLACDIILSMTSKFVQNIIRRPNGA